MSLYFRLFWVWLRARSKPSIQMGDTIELTIARLAQRPRHQRPHEQRSLHDGHRPGHHRILCPHRLHQGCVAQAMAPRTGRQHYHLPPRVEAVRGLSPCASRRSAGMSAGAIWRSSFCRTARRWRKATVKGAIIGSKGFVSKRGRIRCDGTQSGLARIPLVSLRVLETERLMSA